MKWMELTSDDLGEACNQAQGVAMIPVGSLERHGPHLPLGCDAIIIDHVAEQIAAQEPIVVMPTIPYTFVAQCRYHPGAVHIQSDVLLEHLTCICDEIHRNGFSKIIMLHGHGGNVPMSQSILYHVLETGREYAVYSIPPFAGKMDEITPLLETEHYGHAGEMETSVALAVMPELIRLERTADKYWGPSGKSELDPKAVQTPVTWIAEWGEMVCGGPDQATIAKGRAILDLWIEGAVEVIRKVKSDEVVPEFMRRPTNHFTADNE